MREIKPTSLTKREKGALEEKKKSVNLGGCCQSSGEQAGAPGCWERGLPEQAVNRTSSRNNELSAAMETNTFF